MEHFWNLDLPEGNHAPVPNDIKIVLPETSAITPDRLHLLAYIPWDEKYLGKVPEAYRDFFSFVVPYLHARTTDVHTVLSVSHVAELIALTDVPVRERLLTISVILHDSGWAQLSEEEIANSLDYSALAYSDQALQPKKAHSIVGAKMATKLLDEYGNTGLSSEEKALVSQLVYFHDQVLPWGEVTLGKPPIEYYLLGDADRLWSYTHENFWLDTIRKNVPARQYVQNLDNALEDFFLTEQGKQIARRLIAERKAEVDLLPS